MKRTLTDPLTQHREEMERLALSLFKDDLTSPRVQWKELPEAFVIYLLAPAKQCQQLQLFFVEMVSQWLVPGESLSVLSARNHTFSPSGQDKKLYFSELLVNFTYEQQRDIMKRNIHSLAEEIKYGASSPDQATHVLEMKRLSSAHAFSYLHTLIASLMRRYPKTFERDIYREIQHFFYNCKEDFREVRTPRHLARIICSHYLSQKKLLHETKVSPHKRHLHLRLIRARLQYPFGGKKVLGLAIGLNTLREYECFEKRHILTALERLLPGIVDVEDVYYAHRYDENNLQLFYLEVEKKNGEDFTLSELALLRKKLPRELKNSIEYLSPSLFIPRNEEELYRNILQLSGELQHLRDLPHAIISFQDQHEDILRFNVILLRILHEETPPLSQLCKRLPSEVRFMPERIANVGLIRQKYVKQANVFSLEINAFHFLRKNHSVDLVRARQSIVKALEQFIGPFRDYNGGFLNKQNEQFQAIKRTLGEEGKPHEFLIENLFYSLAPSLMQTLISPQVGSSLCRLFLSMLERELSIVEYVIDTHQSKEALIFILKTPQPDIKEKLIAQIEALGLDPFRFAVASSDVEGYSYLAFLLLSPTDAEVDMLLNAIRHTLKQWTQLKQNLQVLRLHLPRATQSLDPRIGTDRTSGVVLKMLFEGLYRFNAQRKLEPALAEDVTISDDYTHYTFKLRRTYWSNGSPLTAHDFAHGWKSILDPHFRSPYAFLLFPIKNAEAAKRGEKPLSQVGIHALDDNTLSVHLAYPAPCFLGLLAHWTYSPLCREVDQRHPGWAYHSGKSYVCNGPFKLSAWTRNDELIVVRNPQFWDASSVKLDKIHIQIIEDEVRAQEMFARGELDWHGDPITKIPHSLIPSLKERGELITDSLDGFYWLQINSDRLPFHSAKMRCAFALAINRQKIIDEVLHSDDAPALGFYRPPKAPLPHLFKDGDRREALRLFEEGLKELGLTRKQLPPIIFTHSEIEEQEILSKAIGKQWEEVFGIEVHYERQLWYTFFETLSRHDYMIGGLAWYSRYDDPIYYLDLMIYREHSAPVTRWKNPRFSALVEQAKQTLDPAKKEKCIQGAQKIALDEMPVIPLLFQKIRYVHNPRLKGVILTNIGQINFREAYLETYT